MARKFRPGRPGKGDLAPSGTKDGMLEPLIYRQPRPDEVDDGNSGPAPEIGVPTGTKDGLLEPLITRQPKPDDLGVDLGTTTPGIPEDPRNP